MKKHVLFPQDINEYCLQCSTDEPKITKDIFSKTQDFANMHMLTGGIIGNLLAILVSLSKTQNILEIGTFTGYSAAMMSSGLTIGKVITLDENANICELAKENLSENIKKKKIEVINDEGIEWLQKYKGVNFDIIFLDSRKDSFSSNIELLYNKLSINGLLIIDNSLARGAVLHPIKDWEVLTDCFNKTISKDARFRTVLLPIRDGLLISQKIR